ncbi:MAG TPA: hypothetical protein PKM07_02665 [Spirochaetota bacterium]|jgi:hypothetical protein|nr:hypothetical protein [Spirochaetota bacterium]
MIILFILFQTCDFWLDLGGTNYSYFNDDNKAGYKEQCGLLSIDINLLFNEYSAHTQYPSYIINGRDSSDYFMTSFYFEKKDGNIEILKDYKISNIKYKLTDAKGNVIPVVEYYAFSRFFSFSDGSSSEQQSYYDCMQDDPLYRSDSINNMINYLNDKNIYDIAMLGIVISEPYFLKTPLSLEYEMTISNGEKSFKIYKNTKLVYKK